MFSEPHKLIFMLSEFIAWRKCMITKCYFVKLLKILYFINYNCTSKVVSASGTKMSSDAQPESYKQICCWLLSSASEVHSILPRGPIINQRMSYSVTCLTNSHGLRAKLQLFTTSPSTHAWWPQVLISEENRSHQIGNTSFY